MNKDKKITTSNMEKQQRERGISPHQFSSPLSFFFYCCYMFLEANLNFTATEAGFDFHLTEASHFFLRLISKMNHANNFWRFSNKNLFQQVKSNCPQDKWKFEFSNCLLQSNFLLMFSTFFYSLWKMEKWENQRIFSKYLETG